MDRNLRTIIVILVATLTSGLATYGVYRAVQGIPVRQVEVAHTYMVVASHPLAMGIRITDKDVKVIPWPERSPVPGSFSKVDLVLKRGVTAPVFENEPLNESKLAPINGGTGMAATIPSGMRAISVRVNEVVGVAGFVEPGTHVDVIGTIKEGTSSVTRVVVSNAQVLSAGTRADQDKKSDSSGPATVVTLLLKPEEAARVVLASTEGQIMLALRNPLDGAPTTNGGTRSSAMFEGDPAPAAAATEAPAPRPARVRAKPVAAADATPAAPPPPKPYVVEAIRGAKRAEEIVR